MAARRPAATLTLATALWAVLCLLAFTVGASTGYTLVLLAASTALVAIVGALSGALARQMRVVLAAHEEIEQLRASGTHLAAQLLEAEDRERERIAQGLHDGTLQTLLVANQDLMEVSAGNAQVARVQRVVAEVIGEMRAAVSDLHPATASHGDLEASLRATAERAADLGRFEVIIEVDRDAVNHHDSLVQSVARELLTNAAKHAQATRVTVRVNATDTSVTLTVGDDGVGMPDHGTSAVFYGHVGLASISERVKAIGGSFEFSTPPGGGTVAKAVLPTGHSESAAPDAGAERA